MAERLLDVSGLKKYYPIKKNLLGKPGAYVKAVNGVDFFINKGETLGLVGESGCGKSTVGKCIIGLEAITEGSITMDGLEISAMKEQERRHIRKDIQMVFQNPYASLNQRRNILQIIDEPMLLIADEPTTALDVTIQAQILELMQNIRKITNASIIFITHDLGVIANLCDRVLVMYAGQVVEAADKKTLFLSPKHPYTRGLLGSLPRLDEDRETLDSIPGSIPLPKDFPAGCRFSTRCEHASEQCAASEPGCYMCGGSLVKCWRYAENKTEKENEQ